MHEKTKPNELRILRLYKAPVKFVWDAWTDPKQAAKWWGPRGFTITTHSKDLRPGGNWVYTMHGPDGTDWPNKTLYYEVVDQRRLVYDHGGSDERPPLFRVTVEFTETSGQTLMDMTMAFPTPEAATQSKKFIKEASGDSTWDRLAEYLAHTRDEKELFVINRSFEAPIERMFEMWTNPSHFTKWLPPTGFREEIRRGEIKPGSQIFYFMTNDSGVDMYGRAHYLAIERPHRLVYTQQFTDKDENVSRHPFAPTWPETMLTTVTLAEEGPHQTRVTIEWEVYGQASREEVETFTASRAGMTQGWTGSFDKLENYLAQL